MKETIHKRIGDEDAATRKIIDEAMDKHCLICHASCGQCHVSRPDYADGGFLAAHRFVKQPSMDTTCASCHGGRVYGEYTGAKDDYEADVHYDNEEMVCMDCHKSTEMHASASMVTTRLDLIEKPTCESCHPDTTERTPKTDPTPSTATSCLPGVPFPNQQKLFQLPCGH
jgi:hypothetical protein